MVRWLRWHCPPDWKAERLHNAFGREQKTTLKTTLKTRGAPFMVEQHTINYKELENTTFHQYGEPALGRQWTTSVFCWFCWFCFLLFSVVFCWSTCSYIQGWHETAETGCERSSRETLLNIAMIAVCRVLQNGRRHSSALTGWMSF